MSTPKTPETPIRIESEGDFRKKVWLSTESIKLEWRDQVLETTESALSQLKADLDKKTPDEKRKIAQEFLSRQESEEKKDAMTRLEERFTGKLEESVLKNPAIIAAATGVAAWVWATAHAIDTSIQSVAWEKLGIMDGIRDWFKNLANDSDGIMKKVWMFFYKMLGGKAWEWGDANWPKPQVEVTRPNENTKNKLLVDTVIVWLKKFSPVIARETEVYKGKEAENISWVLWDEKILSKSYEDLKRIHDKYSAKNPNGIEKDLDIKAIDGLSPLTMYLAIHLIVADEKFLSLFHPNNSWNEWKKLPFAQLLKLISNDMSSVANLSRIKDPSELWKILDDGRDFLHIWDDGEEKWELASRLSAMRETSDEYKWKITWRVIKAIFMQWGNITDDIMTKEGFNDKEKAFIQELKAFSAAIPNSFLNNTKVNLWVNLKNWFAGKALELKEVFSLFLFTWGSTDFDALSWFSKFNVYRFLVKTLSHNDRSSVLAWEYKNMLIQECIKASSGVSNNLPEDARLTFDVITWWLKNMVWSFLSNMSWQLAGAMKDPKVAALVTGGVVLMLYVGRVAMLSKLVVASVIWTVLAIAALWVSAESRDKLVAAQKSLNGN